MRAAIILALLLAACGRARDSSSDLDQLDRELTDANSAGDARDPVIAQATHGRIMVDPRPTPSSNAAAIRPGAGAVPADMPRPEPVDRATPRRASAAEWDCPRGRVKADAFTLGTLARQRPGGKACATLGHSAAWANRLPADLPLYPDARVVEAAGNDQGRCRLRVVSFRSGAGTAKVIGWYHAHATACGYSAQYHRRRDQAAGRHAARRRLHRLCRAPSGRRHGRGFRRQRGAMMAAG